MAAFAEAVTMFLDKPLAEATALKGDYKVVLDINVETMRAMNQNFSVTGAASTRTRRRKRMARTRWRSTIAPASGAACPAGSGV